MTNGGPGGLLCEMTANQSPRWAAVLAPPGTPTGTVPHPGTVPPPGSPAVALVLSGTVGPADAAALCAEVAGLLDGSRGRVILCDVAALAGPGLAAVEALARLKLTVGRLGHRIRFCRVPREMLELLVLTGLDEVLPASDGPAGSDRPAGR
jgi:anti-anti-sigma regulatory factor